MRVERLSEGNFGCFVEFAERAWKRPRTETYYRWRYFDAPRLTTLLCLEAGRCVASVSAFERDYRSGDSIVACLEPFDWYALPEARSSSAGVRAMRGLAQAGMPIIAAGASRYTAERFPRTGYKAEAVVKEYFLPSSGAYLMRNWRLPSLAKLALQPFLHSAASVWFTPGMRACNAAFELTAVSAAEPFTEVDGPGGFRSIPDADFFHWLEKGSRLGLGLGSFLLLGLRQSGQLVAWSFSRLYRSGGLLRGAILDLRCQCADPEVAQRMVRGTARILAAAGADDVRATSTSKFLGTEYRRAGFFRASDEMPATVWSPHRPLALADITVSCIADAAFVPLAASAATPASRVTPRPGLRRFFAGARAGIFARTTSRLS